MWAWLCHAYNSYGKVWPAAQLSGIIPHIQESGPALPVSSKVVHVLHSPEIIAIEAGHFQKPLARQNMAQTAMHVNMIYM